MHTVRFADAKSYVAPKHFDICGLRLQGFDASPSQNFWVGLSQILPGGGCESDASELEKVYVVLEGEVSVRTEDGEVTLHRLDSCLIPAGESRSLLNRSNSTSSMLVIMPYPSGARG